MDTGEDKRLVELTAINRRLKTVTAFLKTKHTRHSIDEEIEKAQEGLNDHTAMFVHLDGSIIQGESSAHWSGRG
jgi:hypothetical protein